MSTHDMVTAVRGRRCGRRGFLALSAGAAAVALTGQRARARSLRQEIEADAGLEETTRRYVRHAKGEPFGLPEGFCVAWMGLRGHHLWINRAEPEAPVTGGILWVPEHYSDAHVRAAVGYYMRRGALRG